MWLYSGPEDTTRVHPEEVEEEMVAQWLRSITRGANRILPFHSKHLLGEVWSILSSVFPFCLLICYYNGIRLNCAIRVFQAFTNMYSPVPNGEPHHGGAEREGSDDIEYADDSSDDDSDNSDDDDEVESPPRSERQSKQSQDPATDHGKAAMSSVKT